jgi:rRNA maturation RNase YbeY
VQFPDFFSETDDEVLSPVSLYCEDVEQPEGVPDEATLTTWLQKMADTEGVKLEEVSYILCSDEYLLKINVDYLQHDYYTDVITFQTTDGMIHGDIFISTERVADNAAQLKVPFLQEMLRVMAHGALHLAGYGDKTPEDEAQMRAKEDQYLAEILPALK